MNGSLSLNKVSNIFENITFEISIENATVNILKITSKMLYNEFKHKKQTVPSAQKKIKLKYTDLSLEWKEIYSLSFTVAYGTKIREFQDKLLNNIVFINEKLFGFKMIDSPLCAFCQTEVESPDFVLSLWYNKFFLAVALFLDFWTKSNLNILNARKCYLWSIQCCRGLSYSKSYYFKY